MTRHFGTQFWASLFGQFSIVILRISVYAIFLLILLIFQFCIPLSMIRTPRIQRQRYDNATTTQNIFGELIFGLFFFYVQFLLIFIFCTTLSNNRAPQSQQQRHNNATTTPRNRRIYLGRCF